MKNSLVTIINSIDRIISNKYLSLFSEKNSLMIYLIHGLFLNEKEIKLNHVNPQQRITIDILHEFVEYHLENNFSFVNPGDILHGLDPENKYIMLTFDDGYYSNHLSLPVLHEFSIPAVYFFSITPIENNHCFWWDIIYRERIRKNIDVNSINNEISSLKGEKICEINKYIADNFGEKAFNPISHIDRPFTPQEFKLFAQDKYVFLGNHTKNHAVLTNYPLCEIRSEIAYAQDYIKNLTNLSPVIISYPNGNYSQAIMSVAEELGLNLGITTNHKKNYIPLNLKGNNLLALNRFTLNGTIDIKKQCDFFRSDFQFKDSLIKLLKVHYK